MCIRDRKLPLTQHLLVRISALLGSTDNDLILAAMLWMGHDGLLRLDEIARPLKVKHIIWGPLNRRFNLQLDRTKTHRQGGPVSVAFKIRQGPCAVRALRQLFDSRNLWNKPEAILFPSRHRSKSGCVSGSWFRRHIKRLCSAIGLDGARYSGHSLRAGGATALFVARVPYAVIKRAGRWRSDACLLYYRDSAHVQRKIFGAFDRLATRSTR